MQEPARGVVDSTPGLQASPRTVPRKPLRELAPLGEGGRRMSAMPARTGPAATQLSCHRLRWGSLRRSLRAGGHGDLSPTGLVPAARTLPAWHWNMNVYEKDSKGRERSPLAVHPVQGGPGGVMAWCWSLRHCGSPCPLATTCQAGVSGEAVLLWHARRGTLSLLLCVSVHKCLDVGEYTHVCVWACASVHRRVRQSLETRAPRMEKVGTVDRPVCPGAGRPLPLC